MKLVGLDCEVLVTNVDEPITGDARSLVLELSMRKNAAACEIIRASMGRHGDIIIIAADTLVSIDGIVLEKPSSHAEAFNMLRKLAGKKHTVYTGVAITKHTAATLAHGPSHAPSIARGAGSSPAPAEESVFVESADVFFRDLTDDEINAYIRTGEPFDKAGAYGAQEKGALLVEKVHGDFYTVVGLPIAKVGMVLGQMGVDIWTA